MEDIDKPRKGIHSYRLFDIAVIDVLLTALAAYIISKKHFITVFVILILISIIVHSLMNIETKTNKWIMSCNI
jgi:hypothetical protein